MTAVLVKVYFRKKYKRKTKIEFFHFSHSNQRIDLRSDVNVADKAIPDLPAFLTTEDDPRECVKQMKKQNKA